LAEKSPRAADRAKVVLWTAIRSLDRLAERGTPTNVEDVRKLFVRFGRGGYIIVYVVQPDTVTVLRLFHVREDRSS
jgi:plasmid stabilization system protein ParE